MDAPASPDKSDTVPTATTAGGGASVEGVGADTVPVAAVALTAADVESRFRTCRTRPRGGEAVAVQQFLTKYSEHIVPPSVVASIARTLRLHRDWTDTKKTELIRNTLSEGGLFVGKEAADAWISAAGGLHGPAASSALFARGYDMWLWEWDGMDACTIACLGSRAWAPADADDVWSILHSNAITYMQGAGEDCNCCKARKLFPK